MYQKLGAFDYNLEEIPQDIVLQQFGRYVTYVGQRNKDNNDYEGVGILVEGIGHTLNA